MPSEEATRLSKTIRHVLICEDEGITVMTLRKALIRAGYVVVGQEGDGEKAVAMARQLRPDLILMDIGLLGPLSGIEATRQILRELEVPIIALTAYSDEEHVTATLEAGACGYIVKPFTSEQLLTVIEATLAHSDLIRATMETVASLRPSHGRRLGCE